MINTHYSYFGMLADDNVEHVAERIRNLLTGRHYTFVAVNEKHPTSPQVRTTQRLEPNESLSKQSPRVHRIGDPSDWTGNGLRDSCGISCSDTYGVWGVHSTFATEQEAYKAASPVGVEAGKHRRTTYFVIEGGRGPDDIGQRSSIQLRQYNGYGEILQWVITPEHNPAEKILRDLLTLPWGEDEDINGGDLVDSLAEQMHAEGLLDYRTGKDAGVLTLHRKQED